MPTPQYVGSGPTATLLRNQIPMGIAPDMLTNPFVNIMLISSGHEDPAENMIREEAVIAYTLGNAFVEFAEHEKAGRDSLPRMFIIIPLYHDRDFDPMEEFLGLKVVR